MKLVYNLETITVRAFRKKFKVYDEWIVEIPETELLVRYELCSLEDMNKFSVIFVLFSRVNDYL